MYSVKLEGFSRFSDDGTISYVTVYADTAEDIPQPQTQWEAGSVCIVMDTKTLKYLNHEGEWV